MRSEILTLNMTQERLAELTRLKPLTIQKIKAGQLDLVTTTLSRVQTALGCEWAALFVENGP